MTEPAPYPDVKLAAGALALGWRHRKTLMALAGTLVVGLVAAGAWHARGAATVAKAAALEARVSALETEVLQLKTEGRADKAAILTELRELRADIRALFSPRLAPPQHPEAKHGTDRERRAPPRPRAAARDAP